MKNNTITVSAKDAVVFMENTTALFKALWELTDMLRLESDLRKHHRAYLHVRDEIDEKVKEARELMNQVSTDTLKSDFMADLPGETADCGDCGCFDCTHNCLICKESPCYEDEFDDENFPFEEADDEADSTVTISKKKLGEMLDDMFTMAEIISQLTLESSKEDNKRMRFYRDAKQEADEIMDRWEDDYEPDEYFSD